jgi:hypothetical protein
MDRRRVISFRCGTVFSKVFLLRFPILIRIFLRRSIVLKRLLGQLFLGMFVDPFLGPWSV